MIIKKAKNKQFSKYAIATVNISNLLSVLSAKVGADHRN